MERVVDFPCFRESELVGDGGEDFDNCEGSFTFGGKLWVCDGAFEVSGFQPDLSPLAKGMNPRLLHEDITWQVSSCAARALSRAAMRDFRQDSTVGMEELEIREGRA